MCMRWIVGSLLVCAAAASVAAAAPANSPLVEAVQRADIAAARALIKQGADVDARDSLGQTPLHLAVQRNDFDLVKALIDAGATATVPSRYGVTPFHAACVTGNPRVIELLLKAGASPNETWSYGETALMIAARTGVVEAVKVLLAHGADVNARTEQGQTALMWAASENHAAAIQALLEAGADMKARTQFGFTPIFFAARDGALDAVRVLVAAGSDVSDRLLPVRPPDRTREQAADVASQATLDGAKIDPRWAQGNRGLLRQSYHPPDGDSLLAVAIVNGKFDVARYLVEQGANPNPPDPRGSLLHAIAWMRKPGDHLPAGGGDLVPLPDGDSLELAKTLLKHGANPNVRIGWEEWPFDIDVFITRTPLNIHIGRGYLSYAGATPFYLAAQRGDVALMRVLLAGGADPKIPTVQNITPLMAAAGISYQDGESPGPRSSVGPTSEKDIFEAVKLAWQGDPESINAVTDFGDMPPFKFNGAELLFQVVPNFNKAGKALGDLRWAGSTALHGAALRGQPEIIQFLVDKGAKLDVKNVAGWTPLMTTNTLMLGAAAKAERVQARALFIKLMRERGITVPDELTRDLLPSAKPPDAAGAAAP